MGFFQSVAGILRLHITSADIPGLLDTLCRENIPASEIQSEGDLEIILSIHRRELPLVEQICEKRGDTLKIRRRLGLYWVGRSLLGRPVLLMGLAVLLFGMVWLPGHIYFVQVEGNPSIPTRLILEAAGESGISFGASRRAVRSEKVKNALLEKLPQLQWVGVNTSGCVAVISVREKTVTEAPAQDMGISSIIASCDAVVKSVTATRGSLLCRVGQAVKAGETLISGYTDCGLTIQATHAEGEIYGWTQHTLTVLTPKNYVRRVEPLQKSTSYSLILGKNRINLWKGSGISGSSCGRIYESCTLTLPGGFALPVTLVKETVTDYSVVSAEATPETEMADFAERYLLSQRIAATVESRQTQELSTEDVLILKVKFYCTEMIGRQKTEEIGDIHG